MTTPPIPQRFVAALAAAVHEARAALGHTPWDEPGIAAAIRQLSHVSLADQLIAFGRAVADPTNETPAAALHTNNRAWDSDWWHPCKTHPDCRARTPDGECANCRADRLGTDGQPQPLRRHGTPPDPQLRAQMLTEIRRPHPIPRPERPKPDHSEAMARARAELDQLREAPSPVTTPSGATGETADV